jgi:16S rRNA (adenine1518-N6/adenine1519-N6)-dimethyltransferase
VAERITVNPQQGEMSLLAVSVQYYGKPRLVSKINRAVFYPRPDVDSALVTIETHPAPLVDVPSDAAFFRVVRAGFSQKRKQLKNALASGLAISGETAEGYLRAAQLDPQRRAETLQIEEWAALTRVIPST